LEYLNSYLYLGDVLGQVLRKSLEALGNLFNWNRM